MRPVYAVSSDGRLHMFRVSDGADVAAPVEFLPAGAKASGLTVDAKEVRAKTAASCGGAPESLWRTERDGKTPAVRSTASREDGAATWEDARGVRWRYVPTANGITAFRGTEVWKSGAMDSPAQPAIVNGVVLVLATGSATKHATLYGLDAVTGKELFSSADAISSFVSAKGLAVANGHICLTTADDVLYCFGIPMER